MVAREQLDGDAFRVSTGKGEATWTAHTPIVVEIRLSGSADVDLLEPIMSEMLTRLERAKVHSFADLNELESYEPDLWARAQDYLNRYRHRMAGVYVLQRSASVVMGVKLLNMFCKDALVAFTRRRDYEKQLQQCIRLLY